MAAIRRLAHTARGLGGSGTSITRSEVQGLRRCLGTRVPGLLESLPDFVTAVEALESGRPLDAKVPLDRSLEVVEAYFPQNAHRERSFALSTAGRFHWVTGRCAEAARQFEAAAQAVQQADSALAAVGVSMGNSAVAWFQAGNFEKAASSAEKALVAAEGSADKKTAGFARVVLEATQVVEGGRIPDEPFDYQQDVIMKKLETARRLNRLVADALPDAGGEEATGRLEAELGEQGMVATLLNDWGAEDGVAAATLRSAAGDLAVHASQVPSSVAWVRPMLISTLAACDAGTVVATDLCRSPVKIRTLAALGMLHGKTEPVVAEGLFRSAIDGCDELRSGPLAAGFSSGRGVLWRAGILLDFANLLENSRRAEERKTDTARCRAQAAELLKVDAPVATLSPRDLRWSLAWVPSPEIPGPDSLGC